MQDKCVQCGHELAAGVKFCSECGVKQRIKCPECGAMNNQGVKFSPLDTNRDVENDDVGDGGESDDSDTFQNLSQFPTSAGPSNAEAVIPSFIEEIRERVKDKKVFCRPDIPEKKLNNAIRSFAEDIDNSEVLVLVDSTLFGSASEGMIITAYSLHAKDLAGPPRSYNINEINEVAFRQSMLSPAITINGNDFFLTAGIGKDAMVILAENLNVLCKASNVLNTAKEIILRTRRVSISLLQRHMRIGYNQAAHIIEQLEKERFISPRNSDSEWVILGIR